MRCTANISTASKFKQSMRTLALNVHFKHPSLGMKKHEILSRATAFLLSVDPKDLTNQGDEQDQRSPYDHLAKSRTERESQSRKQDYAFEPAGGKRRNASELDWLEFCPGKFRPLVHVVASSHVLSPWLWKKYYPQPWLDKISQNHVAYSVDVYDTGDESSRNEPLATFALNPYPIHHPGNMDLAIAHLKQEESALEHMQALGVELLHLTDLSKNFEKDDTVFFEGFEIAEDNFDPLKNVDGTNVGKTQKDESSEEDTRIFMPYTNRGNLTYASQTRFLASTEEPLPEGLCGGPVFDTDGDVCGIIEGIVPKDHEDEKLAGAASFIPYFRLKEFINFAQRNILERVLPKQLFEKVVDIKDGNALNEDKKPMNFIGDKEEEEGIHMDAVYEDMVNSMKKAHTPEQVEAIIATVEREKQEILDILEREGGDLDEVVARVRERTRNKQSKILKQIEDDMVQEAEIV